MCLLDNGTDMRVSIYCLKVGNTIILDVLYAVAIRFPFTGTESGLNQMRSCVQSETHNDICTSPHSHGPTTSGKPSKKIEAYYNSRDAH